MPIQEIMGLTTHFSFKAARRYIDVTKEQKKAAVAKIFGEVPKGNLKVAS